jgi:hypothetical protein
MLVRLVRRNLALLRIFCALVTTIAEVEAECVNSLESLVQAERLLVSILVCQPIDNEYLMMFKVWNACLLLIEFGWWNSSRCTVHLDCVSRRAIHVLWLGSVHARTRLLVSNLCICFLSNTFLANKYRYSLPSSN